MMARSRRLGRSADIWPGFVDALSTLLLVLIFLLVVFVISEFFLSRALSGRDEALERLNRQVAELADLLALEKRANIQMRGDINQLAAQLQASTAERDSLASQLAIALGETDGLQRSLEAAGLDVSSLEEDQEELRLQLAAAMAMLEAERAVSGEARDKAVSVREQLDREREISSAARRQVALLNQQIASLRIQLAAVQDALDARDSKIEEQQIQIANLGQRLNVALANKVEELSRYRSEFFGRLREVLANRSEVSIRGDRFVLQSGVLFDSGSAELGLAGQQQMSKLADLLLEIADDIPDDIEWVLRIDGHTDRRPIRTTLFPSNWELSTARAVAVAKFLIRQGLPPEKLAAAGFGEFQPIDRADSDDAFRRNRRIEFKLTER